jgi:hypothetical protein
MSCNRSDFTAGVVGMLLAFAFSAPAAGHDTSTGKPKNQKIIIMTERPDGAQEGRARADHGESSTMVFADCAGDRNEIRTADRDGKKAKVVLCSRGDVSAAERAKRLEHALARINARDELSPETKARITTALRDAIERLNSGR